MRDCRRPDLVPQSSRQVTLFPRSEGFPVRRTDGTVQLQYIRYRQQTDRSTDTTLCQRHGRYYSWPKSASQYCSVEVEEVCAGMHVKGSTFQFSGGSKSTVLYYHSVMMRKTSIDAWTVTEWRQLAGGSGLCWGGLVVQARLLASAKDLQSTSCGFKSQITIVHMHTYTHTCLCQHRV